MPRSLPNDPISKSVSELRSLNELEEGILIRALEFYVEQEAYDSGGAEALLEDDAQFVRGLFWSSRK